MEIISFSSFLERSKLTNNIARCQKTNGRESFLANLLICQYII
ncbi:MAG: hypothetical protein QMD61_01250 [Methanobacterium sp.]|nr:hypothetical protein [Methanobacterium sp.]